MTLEECPVSLDELKKHLRMPVDGTLDEELTTVLLASAEYIELAVKLWREKKIEAISTAPISKML